MNANATLWSLGLMVTLAATACEKTTTEHRLDGPIRLAMGDCAAAATPFVSGHRPEPFADKTPDATRSASPPATARPTNAAVRGKAKEAPKARPGEVTGDEPTTDDPSRPDIRIAKGETRGDLDEGLVRRSLQRKASRMANCYAEALREDPDLAGTVVVNFTIDRKGRVRDSSAVGVANQVAACVQGVVESIRFPKRDAGEVKARYSFKFSPGSGSAKSSARARSKDAGERADSDPKEGDTELMQAALRRIATAAQAGAEEAARAADEATDKKPRYRPGGSNPLSGYRAQLLECFRTKVPEKRPYGAMIIDITELEDGSHAAVKAISDTSNQTLETCVSKAIGTPAKEKTSAAFIRRCSLAFGQHPIATAEGIDISGTDIRADRRRRGDVAAILKSDPAQAALPDLLSWLQKLEKKRRRQDHKPLASDQPVILRPIGSTPVKVIMAVLQTIRDAGMDAVLAIERNGGWVPIHRTALPGIPVPRGTGSGFSVYRKTATSAKKPDKAPVVASLLIAKGDVWIGLSQLDDYRRFSAKNKDLDLTTFIKGLAEVKKSNHFAERRDIEVAADDDVTYETLVTFLDLLTAVGFSDWTLVRPEHLTAPPRNQ